MNQHTTREMFSDLFDASGRLKRAWTEEDLDLYEEYWALESQENLWAFRQYIDPNLIKGWWVKAISHEFQEFYYRMKAGLRPKLVIEAPPQHGKSRGLQDAIAWISGKDPNIRTIYSSFSDDLGRLTNSYLQRVFEDRSKYGRVFPNTQISVDSSAGDNGRWARNSSLLEFVGQRGSFRNATVDGQINGKGLDLGVIDDPLKGRDAAQSKQQRDKTWTWLLDDFFSRFSEHAGLIITATRWHVDDPSGRFIEHFPDARVLKYPAEYTKIPQSFKNDAWDPRRKEGEPLFPEYKSAAFLKERKDSYTQASWQSLYQQMPIIAGGSIFPVEMFKYTKAPPDPDAVKKSVRYWDKAGTTDGGAYTCGVLIHEMKEKGFVISDVVRGQWNAWDREKQIKSAAERDAATWGMVEIWLEQEPGSGGKESAERSVEMLKGYAAHADKVTGAKEVRAEPYAAQVQAGNVTIVANAKWNPAFVDEHETFPNGKYKDQVDAAAGAFAKVTFKKYRYDTSLSWV